jgi:microcystin-dependent protein
MDNAFIGSIWYFAGNFQIINFAYCNGQLTSIAENSTLYSLLGTTYGGDGVTTFGLPDLRGRMPIGQGTGPGLNTYVMGQFSGVESVTITTNNMPSHNHLINASSVAATTATPSSTMFLSQAMKGGAAEPFYNSSQAANAQLIASTIGTTGGSIPVSILQPVLAANYLIALYGIYPSQN